MTTFKLMLLITAIVVGLLGHYDLKKSIKSSPLLLAFYEAQGTGQVIFLRVASIVTVGVTAVAMFGVWGETVSDIATWACGINIVSEVIAVITSRIQSGRPLISL